MHALDLILRPMDYLPCVRRYKRIRFAFTSRCLVYQIGFHSHVKFSCSLDLPLILYFALLSIQWACVISGDLT